jgi:hypothetical protein
MLRKKGMKDGMSREGALGGSHPCSIRMPSSGITNIPLGEWASSKRKVILARGDEGLKEHFEKTTD